jgi:exoribonuclease R
VQFERTLVGGNPREAAFRTAVRRAGPGASYVPYREGVIPWHSAMAATYAHATAPLRRLADRYVVEAAIDVANGRAVPDSLGLAFEQLPEVMAAAGNKAGQIERATLNLAEAVMLEGREGERFDAVVTDVDERGTRIQLSEPAVVARIDGHGMIPGDEVTVDLELADAAQRLVRFRLAG